MKKIYWLSFVGANGNLGVINVEAMSDTLAIHKVIELGYVTSNYVEVEIFELLVPELPLNTWYSRRNKPRTQYIVVESN